MKKLMASFCMLAMGVVTAFAGPSITIDPKIKYFVPEKRIQVAAKITDGAGVDVARVYFKSADVMNYAFVDMSAEGARYAGTLPAPSADTKAMDFIILVKNGEDKVFRSQNFRVDAKSDEQAPAWQTGDNSGNVYVKSELAETPSTIEGFSDNMVVDAVESAAKFGVVSGIVSTQAAGTGAGAGAAASAGGASAGGAVAGGTVAAATAGVSTVAVAGTVAAVAAGGAAVASGGGGSSSGDSAPAPSSFCPSGKVDITGTWKVTGGFTQCPNELTNAVIVLTYSNSTLHASLSGTVQQRNCTTVIERDSGHKPFESKCVTKSIIESEGFMINVLTLTDSVLEYNNVDGSPEHYRWVRQ